MLALSTFAVGSAQAVTPTIYAQDATITASGDTVTATRIPVQTSSGLILYYDVTTVYGITSNGTLSVLSTTINPSISPIISSFQAGTYVAAGTLDFTDKLTGPGIGPAGTTLWTFAASGGTNEVCAYPYTATWYVGPISSNPIAARIQSAGITSTDYSYGLTGAIGSVCYEASTSLRKLAYSSLSRKRRQENPCRPTGSLVHVYHVAVITPSSPRKRGPRGDRSVHECKASLCLHPCQQAQWYALYRRHKRYCSPCLGTSIRCCRRICSRLRSAQVGVCRVSPDYGRCNPPRKAPQEMAPGVETGVDRAP